MLYVDAVATVKTVPAALALRVRPLVVARGRDHQR
jgi:hypothetical protein